MFPELHGVAHDDLKHFIESDGQQEPRVMDVGIFLDGRNRN